MTLAAVHQPLPVGSARSPVILCADDYAISDGVSRGIEELAQAGRISATSALVTTQHWPAGARRLAAWRSGLAIGLHLNLTAGRPLGPMPVLARGGAFLGLGRLLGLAITGRLAAGEVREEITRQLARFEEHAGQPPDFIDGHQHVHVLPGIRAALFRTLATRIPRQLPLLRDPSDRPGAIVARGGAVGKAMSVSALAFGFGSAARRAGFPVNDGFAGFSTFDRARPFAAELESFFRRPGRRHLVMCHPGYPDEDLVRIDPVVGRRRDELDALLASRGLDAMIWHPHREDGGALRWPEERVG